MTRTFLIAAIATMIPLTLAAQDAEEGSAGTIESRDGTHLMSADDIHVVNANGDIIGEIEEILIDSDGRPAGFMVDMGGFLGLGDNDVAIPLEALEWREGEYVSKMTETQLEQLQPFDE